MGYAYLSLKDLQWDETSNIVPSVFRSSLAAINPMASATDIENALGQLDLALDNEDLGKQFYEKITATSGLKIIDFENLDRNTFHVVTEFTCKKDDEEFRPDITLLINGLPLVFIEVKKPNNRDGILAERNRIITRFKNPKFRRFVNITQLMVFSNNMEYDDGSPEPLEGAFYASASYGEPVFNYFREEEVLNLAQLLQPENPQTEDFVLADTNLTSIKHSPEFATNKNPDTPTNRLSTSLFSRARLVFMLRFGIAYVKTEKRLEKHVMRYPQIFAAKAIEKKLDAGIRKGIIWHTQGSGKTALAFYCVHFLTDYYRRRGIVPKFYFIVDRIDLLDQASREFRSRGLHVHTISSRDEFAADIKSNLAVHNNAGLPEITVVNIQRFKDDTDVVKNTDYALGLQRVYFLDEVHRSYNPEGSFLANLNQSDSQAIKIGLTGTPLLNASLAASHDDEGNARSKVAYNSKLIFGDYIHKYYYNRSIADGYTLRLIREEIETKYKMQLKETLEQIRLLKDMTHRKLVYSHPKFVEPMLDYIIQDFEDYFDELQSELGDELQSYSDLFKTEAEITADIEAIKDALFHFNTENAEVFSQQVTQITDRAEMRKIVKALNDAKSLYNIIRLAGQYELLEKLDFRKITQLSTEANNHLTLLNQREALEHPAGSVRLLLRSCGQFHVRNGGRRTRTPHARQSRLIYRSGSQAQLL
jgi:type I restriction enzyme R subunit